MQRKQQTKSNGMKVLRRLLAGVTLLTWLVMTFALVGCIGVGASDSFDNGGEAIPSGMEHGSPGFGLGDVPAYEGKPFVEANGNVPFFSEDDLSREPFETYSALDSLGRCGPAYALIGPETMPTEKRSSIGMVKPSGWQIAEYDWVDGRYLFNRCHLIAHSLAGENDNPLNLITGTRTMNVLGMLPYEEKVAAYVRETGQHVLYRVTPLYEGDNLVASGVLMEAESVEDGGSGASFCVWCYNVEPGVVIDYATGANRIGDPKTETYDGLPTLNTAAAPNSAENAANGAAEPASTAASTAASHAEVRTYVLNTNTHKFHYPECPSVDNMKAKNKQVFEGTREEVLEKGYEPCGACKP